MSDAGFSFDTATSLGGEAREVELELAWIRDRTEARLPRRSEALLALMGIFMWADEESASPMVLRGRCVCGWLKLSPESLTSIA